MREGPKLLAAWGAGIVGSWLFVLLLVVLVWIGWELWPWW